MASPVDTSVKFAHAEMVGAPTLSGTAGSLLSVLDAFLVTGFGTKAVDSATVSGGVCRLNFASGASAAENNTVIVVSGATPAELNGEQKVTRYSTTWVEFATALPDGAVTGTLSFRMAPLGWEKVFSKTNVAVYRPTDPRSTRPYLRVDDTGTTQARVTMYESMTDVDTGFNAMPGSLVAGGYYWWKRQTAVATAANYVVVGDGRGVYYGPCPSYAPGTLAGGGFLFNYAGDLNSYRSGDAYCAVLTGATGTAPSTQTVFAAEASTNDARAVARRSNAIGGVQGCQRMLFGNMDLDSGTSGILAAAPANVNNGLFLAPILLADGGNFNTYGPRGEFPGALGVPMSGVIALFDGNQSQVVGTRQYSGKTLLRVRTGRRADNNTSGVGVAFFDLTDSWREV